MTEDANEEAAWRDLVAHYATPAAADGTPTPWPTREDLPGPGAQGQEAAGTDASGPDTADLDITGLDLAGPDGAEADEAQLPGPRRPVGPAPFGVTPGPPQIRRPHADTRDRLLWPFRRRGRRQGNVHHDGRGSNADRAAARQDPRSADRPNRRR